MKSFQSIRAILIVASCGLLAPAAFTQEVTNFTIAGGGGAKNGSTYSAMLDNFGKFCSTDTLPIKEVNTSGGSENAQMLLGNKVQAAIMPEDLLLQQRKENPASVVRIKTLFALHPEELHLVVRDGSKIEGGLSFLGKFNYVGDKVTFDNVSSLKGRKVGAVGGSVKTLQIINDLQNWQIVPTPYKDNNALLTALASGKIDAVLMVAGAPSSAVKSIPKGFKLLPVLMNSDAQAFYTTAKVQYENLNSNKPVDTLQTRAVLVTRTFSSPEMLDKLATLRKCFADSLDKIRDMDGSHPKWMDVEVGTVPQWPMYDLPKAK